MESKVLIHPCISSDENIIRPPFGQTKGLTFRQQDGSVITLDVPAIDNGQNWPELKKWIWNRSAGTVRRFSKMIFDRPRIVQNGQKVEKFEFFQNQIFIHIFSKRTPYHSMSPIMTKNVDFQEFVSSRGRVSHPRVSCVTPLHKFLIKRNLGYTIKICHKYFKILFIILQSVKLNPNVDRPDQTLSYVFRVWKVDQIPR